MHHTYDSTGGASWCTNCRQSRSTVTNTWYKHQSMFIHRFRDNVTDPPAITVKQYINVTITYNRLALITSHVNVINQSTNQNTSIQCNAICHQQQRLNELFLLATSKSLAFKICLTVLKSSADSEHGCGF